MARKYKRNAKGQFAGGSGGGNSRGKVGKSGVSKGLNKVGRAVTGPKVRGALLVTAFVAKNPNVGSAAAIAFIGTGAARRRR